jgi:putative ABC transport system substrate-binding protein
VTDLRAELGSKRLEIFREMIPGLQRVLYPYDPGDISAVADTRISHDAARRLGIVLIEQAVQSQGETRATLAKAQKDDVDGILAGPGPAVSGFILEATAQRAIPSMFAGAFMVERGGLASYGPDFYDSGQQAARLVDKILKGGNPAEIPVEVNSKIEFVINLKVAKTLGLTIAPAVLYQATQLIR